MEAIEGFYRVAASARQLLAYTKEVKRERDELLAENERLKAQVKEAYKACSARAHERDYAQIQADVLSMDLYDHQLDLSEILGVWEEAEIRTPASWATIITCVLELRTTLRLRGHSNK
jgi:hypothetical protein